MIDPAAATATAASVSTAPATASPPPGAAARGRSRAAAPARRRARGGPDRAVVVLMSLTAFLVVLALLAGHLRAGAAATPARRAILIRRVYRTTVVETIVGGSGPNGSSVTQSVAGSSAPVASGSAPTTRAS